jgi:hypothetical protein
MYIKSPSGIPSITYNNSKPANSICLGSIWINNTIGGSYTPQCGATHTSPTGGITSNYTNINLILK